MSAKVISPFATSSALPRRQMLKLCCGSLGAMIGGSAQFNWAKSNPDEQDFIRELPASLRDGIFQWTATQPLLHPKNRNDRCFSVKDPTIVRHADKWHVFCTIRSEVRSHQIEYIAFDDWKKANEAERHILKINDGYFCAPQVFYFRDQRKWYLIHQAAHPGGKDTLLPAYSTTTDLADPDSWTKPEYLFTDQPKHVSGWIDFWVICDDLHAHLFFTSLDGRMWRCDTPKNQFPKAWSDPKVVLTADVFEASHTYKIRGHDAYLTLIEAQHGIRRYFKAYVAKSLSGNWIPLADAYERPFASAENVNQSTPIWTESISHGELLRDTSDEELVIDPDNLQFLFQGALDSEMQGVQYGRIPWRLGLLKRA